MAIEREVYVKDEANHGDSDCDHFHDAVDDAVGRNGNDSSNALEESDHVFYARNFERLDPTGLWMPLNVCMLERFPRYLCFMSMCMHSPSYLNLQLFNALTLWLLTNTFLPLDWHLFALLLLFSIYILSTRVSLFCCLLVFLFATFLLHLHIIIAR